MTGGHVSPNQYMDGMIVEVIETAYYSGFPLPPCRGYARFRVEDGEMILCEGDPNEAAEIETNGT